MNGKNHIMVDIETLHTKPDIGMMVEIAALRFNPDTFEPIDEGFYTKLSLAKTRQIDPITLNWWARTIPDRLVEYLTEAPKASFPERALKNFYRYCKRTEDEEYSQAWLWAKPISFDISFIYSYMEEFLPREDNPNVWKLFSRRRAIDVRSWMGGKGFNTDKLKSFNPPGMDESHHDPLFDCYEQLYTIKHNLELKGKLVVPNADSV